MEIAALRKVSELSLQAREFIRRTKSFVGRSTSQRAKHNVNELVNDARKIRECEIKTRHSALARKFGDVAAVVVDGIQIHQVLVNLIQNALEAMEPTAVGQRVLSVATEASNDKALVRIADTGCGIDAHDLFIPSRIIPFRTTKPRGLGLGLTMCRMLIEAHRGEVCRGVQPQVWLPAPQRASGRRGLLTNDFSRRFSAGHAAHFSSASVFSQGPINLFRPGPILPDL